MKKLLYGILTLHAGVFLILMGVECFQTLPSSSFTYLITSFLSFSGLAVVNFSRRVFKKGFDV
jgi:membrane protein implicated in regulation of membrane protease activity